MKSKVKSKLFVMFYSPAENLDAMIAMQTKNKLGKPLLPPEFTGPNGKQLHRLSSKHARH